MRRSFYPNLILLLALVLFPTAVHATLFIVGRTTDDPLRTPRSSCSSKIDRCSLREAILAANADKTATADNPHQIFLEANQTYLLQIRDQFKPMSFYTDPEERGERGDLDFDNFIQVYVLGGPGKATIQGDQSDWTRFFNSRLIHIHSKSEVGLNDLILQKGFDLEGLSGGGAILNEGLLFVQNVDLLENATLTNGGGIQNGNPTHPNASIILDQCLVEGNRANGSGGGISTFGQGFDAYSIRIVKNGAAKEGGGLLSETFAVLYNSTIEENLSPRLGAGVSNFGDLTLDQSQIRNNIQLLSADRPDRIVSNIHHLKGKLYLGNSTVEGSATNVRGCLQITNQSHLEVNLSALQSKGGCSRTGIESIGIITSTLLEMHNSTLSRFSKGIVFYPQGGGKDKNSLAHITFGENEVSIVVNGFADDVVEISNSILSSGTLSKKGCLFPVGSAPIQSLGGNLEQSDSCALNEPSDQKNVPNLGLGTLGYHGGDNETYALLPGSPAIDRISSCTLTIDQRRVLRPKGRGCDSGSYEFEP